MKELMTDEFPEEMNEANLQIEDHNNNSPWYLIDSDKSFCKFWDFFITILILYELIVVPFVLVFPDLYQSRTSNDDGSFIYGEPNGFNG